MHSGAPDGTPGRTTPRTRLPMVAKAPRGINSMLRVINDLRP